MWVFECVGHLYRFTRLVKALREKNSSWHWYGVVVAIIVAADLLLSGCFFLCVLQGGRDHFVLWTKSP